MVKCPLCDFNTCDEEGVQISDAVHAKLMELHCIEHSNAVGAPIQSLVVLPVDVAEVESLPSKIDYLLISNPIFSK